jgi:hypothetical protein
MQRIEGLRLTAFATALVAALTLIGSGQTDAASAVTPRVSFNIQFGSGSSQLSAASRQVLTAKINEMQQATVVSLTGYAKGKKSSAALRKLGQSRTDAVKALLTSAGLLASVNTSAKGYDSKYKNTKNADRVYISYVPEGGMIWADDFDQAAGTSPNPAVYSALLADGSQQLGLPTFGTGEIEHNFPDAAYQDGNGNLDIHTTLTNGIWTSARIWTAQLQTFQYGKLEIRAKFPTGNFNWPAIWMLGANYAPPNHSFGTTPWPASGEIDIAEGLGGNSVDQATLHGLDIDCNCAWNGGGGVTAVAPLQNISASYHVWGMQWQPNQVQFTMDGSVFVTDSFDGTTVTQTFANGSKSYYNSRGVWPFNQPFFLILNNAVPAGSHAANGATSDLLIDYVHYSRFNGYGQLGH